MQGAVWGSTVFGCGNWLWWLLWRENAVNKLCDFLVGTYLCYGSLVDGMSELRMCLSGGELFKRSFNWNRVISLTGHTGYGPLCVTHWQTTLMISVFLPLPPIFWVLSSRDSRSFSDIESKTSLTLIILESKNRTQNRFLSPSKLRTGFC